MQETYQHWHLLVDEFNIAWLTLDRKNASVNSLNREVFDEFDQVLDEVQAVKPKGVIIQSGKKRGFIAGADVRDIKNLVSVTLAPTDLTMYTGV